MTSQFIYTFIFCSFQFIDWRAVIFSASLLLAFLFISWYKLHFQSSIICFYTVIVPAFLYNFSFLYLPRQVLSNYWPDIFHLSTIKCFSNTWSRPLILLFDSLLSVSLSFYYFYYYKIEFSSLLLLFSYSIPFPSSLSKICFKSFSFPPIIAKSLANRNMSIFCHYIFTPNCLLSYAIYGLWYIHIIYYRW